VSDTRIESLGIHLGDIEVLITSKTWQLFAGREIA